jgi:hypothetical protein
MATLADVQKAVRILNNETLSLQDRVVLIEHRCGIKLPGDDLDAAKQKLQDEHDKAIA